MDSDIIRLGPQHRAGAVTTLAEAFQDDPALSWLIPDPAARRARLPAFMGLVFDEHVRFGWMLGSADLAAVTLWRAPGAMHRHQPLWHPGALRYVPVFRSRLGHALRIDDAIRAHLPTAPDWFYLKYAGVRPRAQGKGLGGRVIRAGLAEAGALGVPTILETATLSNVGLYQNLGFDVRSEWTVPRGGPQFWTMHNLATAP